MSNNAQEVKNDSANDAVAVIAKNLTNGANDDIWVDAIAAGDSQKEIAIHTAQSAMLKGAIFINEATTALSAIIEELNGVSDDPDSHVSVALGRAQELMAKYGPQQVAKAIDEESKTVPVQIEEITSIKIDGFKIEYTPSSCYIYRHANGSTYWANLYGLMNNRELVCECNGMGRNKYYKVSDSTIEAIEAWAIEQRQAALGA